jgi:hypothetical protein
MYIISISAFKKPRIGREGGREGRKEGGREGRKGHFIVKLTI